MSVTKKFKLTTGDVNTDIDIMGDEAGNALCDWDGGLIMMDKGHIVLDKAGEEKVNTKVDDILDIFTKISIECGN